MAESRAISRRSRIAQRIVVACFLLALALGIAEWGVSVYVWRMPVDSYTYVMRSLSGQIIQSVTDRDAARAIVLRNAINSQQTYPFFLPPRCGGPPLSSAPAGASYTYTFRRGGAVIETVTGDMQNCGIALIQCAWSLPIYVIGISETPADL